MTLSFFRFLPILFILLFITSGAFAYSYYAPIEPDNKLAIYGEYSSILCSKLTKLCTYKYSITNNDNIDHLINITAYLNSELKTPILQQEIGYLTIAYQKDGCLKWSLITDDKNGEKINTCIELGKVDANYQQEKIVSTIVENPTKLPNESLIVSTENFVGKVNPKSTNQQTIKAGETRYFKITFKPINPTGELIITTNSDTNPLVKASLDPFYTSDNTFDDFEDGDFTANPTWTKETGAVASISTSNFINGSKSFHINATGGEVFYYATIDGNFADKNYSTFVFTESDAVQTSFEIMQGATQIGYIILDSGKASYMTSSGVSNQIGSAAIDTNKWYRVQIDYWGTNQAVYKIFSSTNVLIDQEVGGTYNGNSGTPDTVRLGMRGGYRCFFDLVTGEFTGTYIGEGLANFNYAINPQSRSFDLNSISVPPDANTAIDWNWSVNGTQTNLVSPNDENTVLRNLTEYTDYNVCLNVAWDSYDINGYKCLTINSGKFYGDTNFRFFDENTGLATSATIDFNGTSYTGTSFYLPTKQIANSATNQTITFTITKTNYGTRYYQVDLNQYSDLNIGFALLPTSLGATADFKFWETDQTTLLTNADVTVTHIARNKVVSREKTNATANIDFFLNLADGNYSFHIIATDGTVFDYNTVSLIVNKPKAESTGVVIDANWNVLVSGLGASSDSNITANSKTLFIYSETVNSYLITVSSNHIDPEYYPRTYEMKAIGNQAITLQPYLATTDDATQITLVTQQDNGAEILPYPYATIKIYKLLPITGRSLIEQVITDAKGEALVYLDVGDTYEFEVYDSSNQLLSFDGLTVPVIKITSAKIVLTIDTSTRLFSIQILNNYWFISSWNPATSYISKLASGTKVFGFTIANDSNSAMTILSYVTQNDHNFRVDSNTSSASRFTVNHAGINWADINKGTVIHTVIVTVDGNSFVFITKYSINNAFGGYYDPIQGLKTGIRKDCGCSITPNAYGALPYCVPTLIIALLICTALVVLISLKVSAVGGQGAAIIFALGLVLFTYLTWVPLELTLVVIIIIAAFVINDRGQRGES